MSDSGPHTMTVFGEALECASEQQQSAYLDRACASDPQLRACVEALLRAHHQAGKFLAGEAWAGREDIRTNEPLVAERPGAVIGPYKLLEQIGEGGFGVVFMAEQQHPLRRKVALKVIKPGMDTRQVIARFEAERQALALMDHPNIAHVLDAGETAGGRPYFVMELIRGFPLTHYCNQNNLTPRERLELFVSVCQAVQHAHQKGIIHRDLKPSNVMVTLHDGSPVIKVIDFGIAKAMGHQLTAKTLFTNFAHLVGTPMYMSPEQAEMSGLDVDTRTDIYSLGVLLYELLTGTTPFDGERLLQAGFDEVRRIIREEEPPRPSARISTLGEALEAFSAQRKSDPRQLGRLMRGELDWIVMKALGKDRRRRYETASAFAADVQHFLNNEPVNACPPSAFYRFRKFAARHKAPMLAGTIAAIALLAGTAVSTWQAVRATQQAVRATQAEVLADERLKSMNEERRQAIEAKLDAKHRLFDARLAQSRASGKSRQFGQRLDSWQALREAATLARELELAEEHLSSVRNEAIACLALTDVRRIKGPWKIVPAGKRSYVEVDVDLERYARSDSSGVVTVHSMDDDRELARLSAPGTGVPRTFSPDGVYLAIEYESKLLVWDWESSTVACQLPLNFSNMRLVFSPDSQRFVVGQRDGTLAVHELPDGRETKRFNVGVAPVFLAFSPRGETLAVSAGADVHICELDAEQPIHKLPHQADVSWLAWHDDGILLASACNDHQVYVWDTATWHLHTHLPQDSPQRVAFGAGSDMLLSWGWDDISRLWNPWTGQEVVRFAGGESRLSGDGQRIITMGSELTIWELITSAEYRTLPRTHSVGKEVLREGDISPDGRLLAQGTDQGVRLWDLARGKELAFLPLSRMTDAKFNPSGDALFTSGPAGLYRWPVMSRTDKLRIGPPCKLSVTGFLERIGMDREGRTLVVADLNRGCHLVDLVSDGAERTRPLLQHPRATWAASSPDGRWIVSSTHGGYGIKVWDATGKDPERDLVPENRAATLAFSPDGRMLVTTAHTDYTIWSVGSWNPVRQIRRDLGGELGHAAFSRDGTILAVTLTPSTVDLLDVTTGRHLVRLQAIDAGWLAVIGFSPNGSQLVAKGTWNDFAWDLRRINERLKEIGLDCQQLPYGPPAPDPKPMRVEVDLGRYDLGFDAGAYANRAGEFGRSKRWADATADLARALDLDPGNHFTWHNKSVLCLQLGDVEGYRQVCREMLLRFGHTDNPNVAERTAKTCLLAPDAVSDYEPVLRLAQQAITDTESGSDYLWFVLARGMADFRTGQFKTSIDWLKKSVSPGAENPYRDGLAHLFVAMAHQRLGQTDDAQRAMKEAQQIEQLLPKADVVELDNWPDWLRFQVVRREAEEMLNKKSGQ